MAACAGGTTPREVPPEPVLSNAPSGEGTGGGLPAPAETAPAPSAEAPAASAAPSASASPPASASAPAAASASAAPASGVPVSIAFGDPKFTMGDVPKAKGALEKLAPKLKACVDDAGGLTGATGTVEVQFLVRSAGKAEGVDVVKAKGISDAAKKCIVSTLQKKTVGTPSTDPIGVTIVLSLSPAK